MPDLLARRRRSLAAGYRLFYENPVHVVRGEGVWLFDAAGRRYLDAYNNVPSVGHANPRVTSALAQQAATLNVHTRYLTDEVVDYAERLLALFAEPLDRVTFTCSGSEANDLAYRMAREFTGAEGVIVTANAYHGVTTAVAGMSPSLSDDLAPWVRTVAPPDPSAGEGTADRFAAGVREAVADLGRHGVRPAALLLDTALSSDGIVPDPVGMFARAVDVVRAAGGVYVADEVQSGFGRLGHGMWGFDRHGLVPDLVTLGKPMGNGYPLAAVVARAPVATAFGENHRYFNTFGGSSVAAAVGTAVLDEIEERGLVASAFAVGDRLRAGLRELAAKSRIVGAVRGSGLFVGVDIGPRGGAQAVVDGLRERGVLISSTGPSGATLKIRPPLVFSHDHADLLLAELGSVLRDLENVCDDETGGGR